MMTKTKAKKQSKKTVKKTTAKSLASKKADSLSSKTMSIYAALKQKDGATVEELANLTGWQDHSVRGFLSTIRSKNEIYTVDKFTRTDSGKTAYKLEEKESASKE